MIQHTTAAAANTAPTEIERPRRSTCVFEIEPRPIPSSWGYYCAPEGTPIWGGFTVGMTYEQILSRFPMAPTPGGALWGLCKLFGFEARVTCEIDPNDGLEALYIDVTCADEAEAADTLYTIFHLWRGELHPTRFLTHVEGRGELQSGNLHVGLRLLENPGPGVLICMRAVDPESYTVHFEPAEPSCANEREGV
jgi:hypothetical protein